MRNGAFGAGCFITTATLMPSVSEAQMDKLKLSMTALQAQTAKLGEPRIEGNDPVAGKDVPALYFGKTNMNNFFDVAPIRWMSSGVTLNKLIVMLLAVI